MRTLDGRRGMWAAAALVISTGLACSSRPDRGGAPARATGAVRPAGCPAALVVAPPGDPPPPAVADPHAGAPLRPAWEIRPPPGATLAFDGLVDRDGNAYWRELEATSDAAAALASAGPGGALRFRVPTGAERWVLAPGALVGVVAAEACGGAGRRTAALEGRSAADGALRWRRDLLPVVSPWLRTPAAPGACVRAAVSGLAGGAQVLAAVSVLDASGAHESGYVALDPGSGEVQWAERTSAPGNVMPAGAPVRADDGVAYGSRTDDYRRDDLLVFAGGGRPRTLATPAEPWHGAPVAAGGALLLTRATGGASWSPPPSGLEVRCRGDGSVVAPAGTLAGAPAVAGGALWLLGDDALSRWDASSGALTWRVALAAAPPASRLARPFVSRSAPVLVAGDAIAFTEQPGTQGRSSADLALGPALLRVVDARGVEVLRRELPREADGYGGPAAAQGARFYSTGFAPPSAGGRGVLRAFDLPLDAAAAPPGGGRAPAPRP